MRVPTYQKSILSLIHTNNSHTRLCFLILTVISVEATVSKEGKQYYLLLLILLLAGSFLVYVLIRPILQDIQAHRKHEAYRDYILAYGSEEEMESLMMDEMEDMLLGITGLRFLDMVDGDIDLW